MKLRGNAIWWVKVLFGSKKFERKWRGKDYVWFVEHLRENAREKKNRRKIKNKFKINKLFLYIISNSFIYFNYSI